MNDEPWLDLATRYQLERDLTDLPELTTQLERNYDALLARGDRNPDDPQERYPIRTNVLDLADRRWKQEAITDPAGEADLARRIGARRLGILPTLASWVSLTVGEMHDAEAWHTRPADPDQVVWVVTTAGEIHATKPGPTVASEAGWLRRHLDWIVEQQWVTELADEVRQIVTDLDSLGISHEGPDHHATGTLLELSDALDIPAGTLRRWAALGWLAPITDKRPKLYVRHEAITLRFAGR